MDYQKLETLVNLRNAGEISEAEFEAEKKKLQNAQKPIWESGQMLGMEKNTYYLVMHITLFFSALGIPIPLILWFLNKDNDEGVDIHGKVLINWMISSIIYSVIGVILAFFIIGFVLLGVLVILSIVFCIKGALKAQKGIFWNYPLSIDFFGIKGKIKQMNQAKPPII